MRVSRRIPLAEGHPVMADRDPSRPDDEFLVFGAPVLSDEEVAVVEDCLRRRWIGTGPKVAEFERAFAAYKHVPYAVAVNSGTAALHLALLACGVGPGDEVITSTMTFCSTANVIGHAGALPVLVDCDRSTFNITAEQVATRLNDRTKAIIVVHMCGRCCDMAPIMNLARDRGLVVVEDCAHAIESEYHGTPAGVLGDIGCFSFYVTKNLTTVEGGAVLTRDGAVAAEVQMLANHGLSHNAWRRYAERGYRHYTVERAGFKYNMTDINAAIGLVQFGRLAQHARRRAEIWHRYDEAFADLPCFLPPSEEPATRHARHLYTPLLDLDRLTVTRNQVLDALVEAQIGVGMHYLPVHRHPYYRDRWPDGSFPNADFIGERTLSLPLAGDLTHEDVERVCRAFRRILTQFAR